MKCLKFSHWFLTLVTAVCAGLIAPAAQGQIAENNRRLSLPDSRLHREYEAPILLVGHGGIGGSFQQEQGQLNYGGSLVFRPGSADNFLDMLYRLNAAMVMRLDYLALGPNSRILSADLILRHYLAATGKDKSSVQAFLGVGFGASDVNLTAAYGGRDARYWSSLAEAGFEIQLHRNLYFVTRCQYRYFNSGGVLVSSWSAGGGIGIPLPW